MQSLEKHVEKQIIVRMFEPDMNVLKQAARQISAMPDTALNLYGQGGEVLLVYVYLLPLPRRPPPR